MRMALLKTGALFATLVTVIGLGCFFARTSVLRGEAGPQTPSELWNSWSREAKEEYVLGYVSGFREGKRAACSFYEEKVTQSSMHTVVPVNKPPKANCISETPEFRALYLQVYVDAITGYYSKYPNDRQAGLPRLMFEMTSPPDATIDQIHEKLVR